jgi:hypothetical protein
MLDWALELLGWGAMSPFKRRVAKLVVFALVVGVAVAVSLALGR